MKNDLISREALRKEVTEKVNFTTVDGHIAYDKMLKLIDNAPTVEPENLIKPIAEIRCEITDEEKQRLIELLRKEKPKLVKLEPDRLQGKWKIVKGYDGDEYYECSNCGEPWVLSAGTPKDNNMNFCPNCGAKMTGGEEE